MSTDAQRRSRGGRAALLAATLAGFGCSHLNGAEEGSGATAVSTLRPGLLAMRAQVEQGFAEALAGDVPAVERTLNVLYATWEPLRAEVAAAGATPAGIDGVDAALSRLELAVSRERASTVLARSVNFVTVALFDVLEQIEPGPASRLLLLDYFARELVVDALQGELAAAALRLSSVEEAWEALAPVILGAGGERAARAYEDVLEVMSRSTRELDARRLYVAAVEALRLHERMRALLAEGPGGSDL